MWLLALIGAFAVGVGLERMWPAARYGGLSPWAWILVGSATLLVVAVSP